MFYDDSIVCFSVRKGVGESYYLLCPACGNLGMKVTDWEDETKDEEECLVCRRMEEEMQLEMYWK